MNCNEIRELISSMLDHELSAEDSAVVTEHLAECPECMRVFEAFHAISVSLEELEEVPDGFTEAVMHKINTPAPVKKRRPAYLRLAGLAACLALVIFTGSRFVTSHTQVGGHTVQDTTQYARVTHQTPKPTATPAPTATAELSVINEDNTAVASMEADETTPVITPTPTPAVTATPMITPTPVPAVTPTPVPHTVAPTQLTAYSDLLFIAETAAFDLHSDAPQYTVTVQDIDGRERVLLIWLDNGRIYCKDPVNETAWYTIGTPEQLLMLLGIELPPSPAVSPEVTSVVSPDAN